METTAAAVPAGPSPTLPGVSGPIVPAIPGPIGISGPDGISGPAVPEVGLSGSLPADNSCNPVLVAATCERQRRRAG